MKKSILAALLFVLPATLPAQSVSDSAEFRKTFLRVFNSRTRHFAPILKDKGGELSLFPGADYEEVDEGPGDADSIYSYEAIFYHEDEKQAREAFRQLLVLIRHSLRPYVLHEQRATEGKEEIIYFFQREAEFYYDSYLEASFQEIYGGKDWWVTLRIHDRPRREIYYVNKGQIIKDDSYKRFLQKTELASFPAFKLLKGKKLTEELFSLKDSVPGYNGRMYETEGGTVVELVSGFRSNDPEKAIPFFYEQVARIKSGLPATYAYYRHPAPGDINALEQVIFQKAYTEVNTFPAFPRLSYTLTRSAEDPTVYNVWLRVIRHN